MTVDELVQAIRDNFKQRIERKTGWGKNEIITELDAATVEEAMKALKPFVGSSNAGGQISPASGGNLDRLVGSSESKGE